MTVLLFLRLKRTIISANFMHTALNNEAFLFKQHINKI